MSLKSKKAASKGHLVTFACSPSKRSSASQFQKKIIKNPETVLPNFPIPNHIFRVFPTAGIKRIVSQYSQMEDEVATLKQKYYESKLKIKTLKANLAEQKKTSRTALVSCAMKLYEKEKELERLQDQREEELRKLTQDLYILQSSLLKEQAKLKQLVNNNEIKISNQQQEIHSLREAANVEIQGYVGTPDSSLGNSPDSSFSIPAFDDQISLPLPTNSSRASRRQLHSLPPIQDQSGNDAFICQKKSNILFGERIKNNTNVETISVGDEGFCSSQEENNPNHDNIIQPNHFSTFLRESGLAQKSVISPSVTSTNHKGFRKPSDLKKGQKTKTKLNLITCHELSALDEHP